MKKTLASLFFMSLTTTFSPTLKAQNLVPNPSFEIFDTCPDNVDQVNRAQGWSSFGNTPDYFNTCDSTGNMAVSIPHNALGYQLAADGSAYCGLFNHEVFEYREYIGSQLINP